MAPKRSKASSSSVPLVPKAPKAPRILRGKFPIDWSSFMKSPIRFQVKDICWALEGALSVEVSINALFATIDRESVSLSSQSLVNAIGDEMISTLKIVEKFIKEHGLPYEHNCEFIGYLPKRMSQGGTKGKAKGRGKSRWDVKIPGDVVKITGAESIDSVKEEDIMRLLEFGPVVGVLECNPRLEQMQQNDIYSPLTTSGGGSRHCVLITDHDENDDDLFWICRDSRGYKHGYYGYIRVQRDKNEKSKSVFSDIWLPRGPYIEES